MSASIAEQRPVQVLESGDPVAHFTALPATALIALPTSGTAGLSRTIVRTVESWRAAFPVVTARTGLTSSSRLWLPGPLTATMNLYAAAHAAAVGARLVTGPEQATHIHLTPHVLLRLLGESAPLHNRILVVAGDGLDQPLRLRAEAAGATVCHYYGAAELSFVAWGGDRQSLHPLPEVEVQVRDREIWVRGPYLARGYLGDQPGPMRSDDQGFVTVGDRGDLEVDGRLTVTGRDGAILTGGVIVLVADVEAALRPLIQGPFAVIGLPHPDLGEIVAAVVTDPEARRRCRVLALGAGRPRRWVVRPELPVTTAGKLDRRRLVADLSSDDRFDVRG